MAAEGRDVAFLGLFDCFMQPFRKTANRWRRLLSKFSMSGRRDGVRGATTFALRQSLRVVLRLLKPGPEKILRRISGFQFPLPPVPESRTRARDRPAAPDPYVCPLALEERRFSTSAECECRFVQDNGRRSGRRELEAALPRFDGVRGRRDASHAVRPGQPGSDLARFRLRLGCAAAADTSSAGAALKVQIGSPTSGLAFPVDRPTLTCMLAMSAQP